MPDGAGGVWLPRTAVGTGDELDGTGEVVVATEVGVAGRCEGDPDCVAAGDEEGEGGVVVVPSDDGDEFPVAVGVL